MSLRLKLWLGIGVFALANAAPIMLKSLSSHAQGQNASGLSAWAAGGKGGEGGEAGERGQGSEMGEMGQTELSELVDDIAYLTQLGLVQGHLTVGVALYGQGATEDANVHMKHPQDELYARLLPALKARKARGFDDELLALATSVESGKAVEEAETSLSRTVDAIDRARAAVRPDVKEKLRVVLALTRVAADEYARGVKEGVVVNPKEYEDAWGFVAVAKTLLQNLSKSERKKAGDAYGKIEAELAALSPAWPSVAPPARVDTDPSLLYAAAARVELAILRIR